MFGFLKNDQTKRIERLEEELQHAHESVRLAWNIQNRAIMERNIHREKMKRQRRQLRQLQQLYNAFRIGQRRSGLTKDEAKEVYALAAKHGVSFVPMTAHPDDLRDPDRHVILPNHIGAVTTDLPFKLVDGKPVPYTGEVADER